jgi:3'-phosphoadenosine 5'-phosphosulfate (PAPS) 3'-phosphatase
MKIFGIGLSKTGTTSLAHALEILGYRTKDYPGIDHYIRGDLNASISSELLDEYDAFTDTPIPSFYRELDARYPDSKFILTIRDMEGWLKSCKKQFTQKLADKQNEAHNSLFIDLYDCNVFGEQKFREGYERFTNGVINYFQNRPDDLLIMDVSGGDGWKALCPFLEKAIPDIPFPKSNVTRIRWMDINDITAIAQRSGREAFALYSFLHPDPADPAREGVGVLQTFRHLFSKVRYRLLSDLEGPRRAAANLARRLITAKLQQLTPQIPIVFPGNSEEVPHSTRNAWNHFWLVDPLGYETAEDGRETGFTLGIALIEDRVSILGVVYVPTDNTTYYSMSGKGAFRISDRGETTSLKELREQHRNATLSSTKGQSESGAGNSAANATLSMCLIAAGAQATNYTFPQTMEWQTAAAHAILKTSGMQILCCKKRTPLSYNKEKFSNDCITIG